MAKNDFEAPSRFSMNDLLSRNNIQINKQNNSNFAPIDTGASETVKELKLYLRKTESSINKITRELGGLRSKVGIQIDNITNSNIPDYEALGTFYKIQLDTLKEESSMKFNLQKAKIEAVKQIRDEKKHNLDVFKTLYAKQLQEIGPETQQQETSTTDTTNPIHAINSSGVNRQYVSQANMTSNIKIQRKEPIFGESVKQEEPIEVETVEPKKEEKNFFNEPIRETNTQNIDPVPIKEDSDMAVYNGTGLIKDNAETYSEHQDKVYNKLLGGLDMFNSEVFNEMMLNDKTAINARLGHSLRTFKQKEANVDIKLFINEADGTFYTKGFYYNDGNQYVKEYEDTVYQSIIHLGQLYFDKGLKMAKTQYSDTMIPYEIINDPTHSTYPEYYKEQWSDPKTMYYVLDDTVIQDITH